MSQGKSLSHSVASAKGSVTVTRKVIAHPWVQMHSAFALEKPQWRFDTHRYVGQCRGHKVHRSRSIMLFSELEKAERVDTVIVKEPNGVLEDRGETLKKKVEILPLTTCGSQGL